MEELYMPDAEIKRLSDERRRTKLVTKKLSVDIYPHVVIAAGVDAYHSLGTLCVEYGSELCEVTFADCTYGNEVTAAEFCNYLIELLNNADN